MVEGVRDHWGRTTFYASHYHKLVLEGALRKFEQAGYKVVRVTRDEIIVSLPDSL